MTKHEFLERMGKELRKNGIGDSAEILGEYEEHFNLKLADGYTEEQIAEKLGNPLELAAQYEAERPFEKRRGRRLITGIGLAFADIFAACCFVTLWVWAAMMLTFALACGLAAVRLIGGLGIRWISIPYGCGVVFGLSLIALMMLTLSGCVYFVRFLRQLMRAFARFNHNAMALASGRPILPPVGINPQFGAKTRRKLRQTALIALGVFALLFVLGLIAAMLSAQAIEFWHAWGWFGYAG